LLTINILDKGKNLLSNNNSEHSPNIHPKIMWSKTTEHSPNESYAEVGTSAPPSAPAHRAPVRNRIFGAELMVRNRLKKKVRNGGCGAIKITAAPPHRQKIISI